MPCCGSRRAAQKRSAGLRAVAQQPAPPAAAAAATALRYSGPVPMLLPSPSGGRPYSIRTAGQQVAVTPADAPALLRTGWFEVG